MGKHLVDTRTHAHVRARMLSASGGLLVSARSGENLSNRSTTTVLHVALALAHFSSSRASRLLKRSRQIATPPSTCHASTALPSLFDRSAEAPGSIVAQNSWLCTYQRHNSDHRRCCCLIQWTGCAIQPQLSGGQGPTPPQLFVLQWITDRVAVQRPRHGLRRLQRRQHPVEARLMEQHQRCLPVAQAGVDVSLQSLILVRRRWCRPLARALAPATHQLPLRHRGCNFLLTRRARIALGTATQCTRRNDPPRPARCPPTSSSAAAAAAAPAPAPQLTQRLPGREPPLQLRLPRHRPHARTALCHGAARHGWIDRTTHPAQARIPACRRGARAGDSLSPVLGRPLLPARAFASSNFVTRTGVA
jgi:hypothetical protein